VPITLAKGINIIRERENAPVLLLGVREDTHCAVPMLYSELNTLIVSRGSIVFACGNVFWLVTLKLHCYVLHFKTQELAAIYTFALYLINN
jgi:hypothetical protein